MKKQLKCIAAAMGAVLMLAGCSESPKVSMDDAEVTLGNYTGIEITLERSSVSEEDVDIYLNSMLNYYNTYVANERTTVEAGDSIYLTLYLYGPDGILIEKEGNASSFFLDAGVGHTYPEVDEALIGAEAGKEFEVPVELEDGEGRAFVVVEYILADKVSAETMTDEEAGLVMKAFEIDGERSVENLYQYVRDLQGEQNAGIDRTNAYNAISSYLLETCTVDPFPDKELKDRMDAAMEQTEAMCTVYYGMTFDQYCKAIGTTQAQYKVDMEASITDDIKLELIYMAIGDAEGIHYEEDDYQAYVEAVLESNEGMTEEDLYDIYEEDYLRNAFRTEYIVDWLIERADITYVDGD